jgi:hypothetical protein
MMRHLPIKIAIVSCAWLLSVPAFAQVDFSGQWSVRYHEDQEERSPGGQLGDYTGLPLNDAARLRADSWDAALYGLKEWQCRPHGSTYMWRSVHPVRITQEVQSITGEVVAIRANFEDLIDRVIYLDGRPHPSEDAPHTWAGFSTGVWEGNMLTVTTTHLKEYIIRRDGVPLSDRATMVEHWLRHDNVLSVFQIVTDPVYFTEPFIQSTDFVLNPNAFQDRPELCEVEEETDHPAGWVPHRLPGTTHDSEEFAKKYNLPVDAARGGAESMYPDYRKKLPAGAPPAQR